MAELDNDVTAEVVDTAQEEEIRICLFTIGEDYYALPVGVLTEIIIPQKIFPVPTTPPHVLGVINLRGNIVPIVDIRPALALPRQSNPGQIAVLKQGQTVLGIVVDSVSEVISVPESSLLPLPSEQTTLPAAAGRNRYFKAVVQLAGGSGAGLLDVEQMLEAIKLA